MWPLTQHKGKVRTFRPRNVSYGARALERRKPRKPLISEAPPAPWVRAAGPCALAAVMLGIGGFAFVTSGFYGKARAGAELAMGRLERMAGLTISRVVVTGRDRSDRAAILAALEARQGASILSFDCAGARARLLQIPWVADAQVRRVFPGDIEVDLDERRPFAVWQYDGRLMLVDRTGYPIVPVSAEDLTLYPHVVGAGAAEHAEALLSALKAFPDISGRVKAAVRVGDRRWDLKLDNGMAIELPADGIATALGEVTRLDRDMGVLSSDLVAIDMRFKDRWILKGPAGDEARKPGPARAT